MRDLGILDRRRCELINGIIWDIAPEGEFHRFINDLGAEYLRRVLQVVGRQIHSIQGLTEWRFLNSKNR